MRRDEKQSRLLREELWNHARMVLACKDILPSVKEKCVELQSAYCVRLNRLTERIPGSPTPPARKPTHDRTRRPGEYL